MVIKNKTLALTDVIKNAYMFLCANPLGSREDWEKSLLFTVFLDAFETERDLAWKIAALDLRDKFIQEAKNFILFDIFLSNLPPIEKQGVRFFLSGYREFGAAGEESKTSERLFIEKHLPENLSQDGENTRLAGMPLSYPGQQYYRFLRGLTLGELRTFADKAACLLTVIESLEYSIKNYNSVFLQGEDCAGLRHCVGMYLENFFLNGICRVNAVNPGDGDLLSYAHNYYGAKFVSTPESVRRYFECPPVFGGTFKEMLKKHLNPEAKEFSIENFDNFGQAVFSMSGSGSYEELLAFSAEASRILRERQKEGLNGNA